MPRMRRFVIVIAVSLCTTGAFAQPTGTAIDKDARDTIEAWHVPGLAIAVVQNDKVIFLKGYGIREIGGTEPVSADLEHGVGADRNAVTDTARAILPHEDELSRAYHVRSYVLTFNGLRACTGV